MIVRRGSSKVAMLRKFVTYAVTTGQRYGKPLEFAPLPQNVVAKDKTAVKGL